MSEEAFDSPVIVIKKRAAHGVHGGSWKVAFADFAVAMMAFFLLMWLMGGTSDEQQKQIAGYFKRPQDFPPVYDQIKSSVIRALTDAPPAVNGNDAIAYGAPREQPPNVAGLDVNNEGTISDPDSLTEQEALDQLQQELLDDINNSDEFSAFKKQIYISAVPEGVKLDVVDNEKQAMFQSGSAKLEEEVFKILMRLAPVIQKVPNHISITGHTDAAPYISSTGQTNWELSAERANAARRALEAGGVSPEKITQVVGQGSTGLFDPENPTSALNRRISIVILNARTDKTLRNPARPGTKQPATPVAPTQPTAPAHSTQTKPQAENDLNPEVPFPSAQAEGMAEAVTDAVISATTIPIPQLE